MIFVQSSLSVIFSYNMFSSLILQAILFLFRFLRSLHPSSFCFSPSLLLFSYTFIPFFLISFSTHDPISCFCQTPHSPPSSPSQEPSIRPVQGHSVPVFSDKVPAELNPTKFFTPKAHLTVRQYHPLNLIYGR